MIKHWRLAGVAGIVGLALIAVGSTTMLFLPRAEAADCGGFAGGMEYDWLATTPSAIAKNQAGECGPDATCQEWCLMACGEPTEPQGVFRCQPL